jgi:hypothetical protein
MRHECLVLKLCSGSTSSIDLALAPSNRGNLESPIETLLLALGGLPQEFRLTDTVTKLVLYEFVYGNAG